MKPVSCFYITVCKKPNTLKFDSEIWFMITDIVTIGSLANKPKNRRKTTLTEENVNMIGNLMQSPRASLRRVSQQTFISYGSVHTAARRIMNLYPYKSRILQSLTEEDFDKRLVYCNWFLEFTRLGMFVLDKVFFTDEAYKWLPK